MFGVHAAIQAETRSPSPRARKRCTRKLFENTRITAAATLDKTPRREYPIPSGAAMHTTTRHVHGNASRYCKWVRNGANNVGGKSALKCRYSRNSGTLRDSACTFALLNRNGVSLQCSIVNVERNSSLVMFPAAS